MTWSPFKSIALNYAHAPAERNARHLRLLAFGDTPSTMRFLLPLALLLAACGQQASEAPVEFDGEPRCGAEDFFYLLGRNASVLDGIVLPQPSRVLRPEDVIALDFSPDRLTIDIDTGNRISSVTCR